MTPSDSTCFLITSTGEHRLRLAVASGFMHRLRGLMLMPPLESGQAMLLLGCASIHTCFMRQALDVVYLDASGIVTCCVTNLRPWNFSMGNVLTVRPNRLSNARHVLEMSPGSIRKLEIRPGSRVRHAVFGNRKKVNGRSTQKNLRHGAGQQGSAMIEFAVVAPLMTLIGLATIQYGLLFFAKNQYNHAAFMAARAGSTGHASMARMKDAYSRALVPLHGGGTDAGKLADSYGKATAEMEKHAQIVMLNPTAESFADFNDLDLQQTLGSDDRRVIPNGGLAFRKPTIVPAASGQNIQDANLLKLRITHAYRPQVPLVGAMYTRYLQWLDPGTSEFVSEQIKLGRIPVVTHVTLHMQSDAIQEATLSSPGRGNNGAAVNPGDPPITRADPPACASTLCTQAPAGAGTNDGGPVDSEEAGGRTDAGSEGTSHGGDDGSGIDSNPGESGSSDLPAGPCYLSGTPMT